MSVFRGMMYATWNCPRRKSYLVYFGMTGFLVLLAVLSKLPGLNQESYSENPANTSKLIPRIDSSKLVRPMDSNKSVQPLDSSNLGESKDSSNLGESKDSSNLGESKDSSNLGESKDSSNLGESKDSSNLGESKGSSNLGESKDSSNLGESKDFSNLGESKDSSNLGESKDSSKLIFPMDFDTDNNIIEPPNWKTRQTISKGKGSTKEKNEYVEASRQSSFFVDKTRNLKEVNLQNENELNYDFFYYKNPKEKGVSPFNQVRAVKGYSSEPSTKNITTKTIKAVTKSLKNVTGGTSVPYKYLFKHLLYKTKLELRRMISRNDLRHSLNPGTTLPLDKITRVLIASTWRSGSTFLGDVVGAYPGAFYSFEPLHIYLKNQHLEEGESVPRSLQLVKDIYYCNYTGNVEFVKYMQANDYLMSHNTHVWRGCSLNRAFCFDPQFLSEVCRLYPLNVIKSVRLGLNPIAQLLKDKDLNLKVIHLVRDPRGSLLSRRNLSWCISDVCRDPATVCQHLQMDLQLSEKYSTQFPDRFFFVRYEDLSLEPERVSKEILDFIGLRHHKSVERFLKAHTQLTETTSRKNLVGTYTTFRDSQKIPFAWREKLSFEDVRYIQNNCEIPMKTLGYTIFNSAQEYYNKSIPALLPL